MALMKAKGATRFFLVQADPVAPAVLEFCDATPGEIAAHRRAIVKSHEGNRGVFLDDEHLQAQARVQSDFVLARIVKAHNFAVEEGGAARQLEWPQDKDAILALIPDGLLDLFRRTVESLNMPASTEAFQSAALVGTTTFPNS